MNKLFIGLEEFLEHQPRPVWGVLSFALLLLVGFFDYVTGADVSFIVFYLIPLALAAWYVGRAFSIIMSLAILIAASVVHWVTAPYFVPADFAIWNAIERLVVFIVFALILSALKRSLDRENELARTDYLTGIANGRAFSEMAKVEISRSHRYGHPITIVFIDVDNFKEVNDRFGHSTGNVALRTFAETLRQDLRFDDVAARLGGDEFVLMLPETGYDSAAAVCGRIQKDLIADAQRNGWPVTFSIGVVTYTKPPESVDAMIYAADRLMYDVKKSGKNAVKNDAIIVK